MRRISAPHGISVLTTQAQTLDQGLVAFAVFLFQISQQTAAGVDHFKQATTGVIVVLVCLEVLGQVFDACGQQGDLHFRGTGIVRNATEIGHDFLGINCHFIYLDDA